MRRSAVGSFVTSLRRCVVGWRRAAARTIWAGCLPLKGPRGPPDVAGVCARPYVKAQKNDDLDAEAIMRFVEVKSQAQSDIQALHRARERLVSEPPR
jgi:transposase